MVKLAKRMKKNTINVDIVAFGDLASENTDKIEAFHENIKGSGDGSNLAVIPPGPNLLSDSILATPILGGDGQGPTGEDGGAGAGGGGGGGFDFGVDPNNDPELALALRMSMEEEERRRQREERDMAEEENKAKLETVPEDGSSGGEAKKDGEDKKDQDPNQMDTA